MTMLTYNEVYNMFGEETMLAYENLVDRYISNEDATIEILLIAHLTSNLNEAQQLIERAKQHAMQEIEETQDKVVKENQDKIHTYYEVQAQIDGQTEILYGSYVRKDCAHEVQAERDSWKDEGYKAIKIVSRETTEQPDKEVYDIQERAKLIIMANFSDYSCIEDMALNEDMTEQQIIEEYERCLDQDM